MTLLAINIADWDSSDWGIMIAVAVLIGMVGGLYIVIKNIGKGIEKIPNLENRISKNELQNNSLENTLNIIARRIDSIWENQFSESHSPRRLNDRGVAILNDSGIKDVLKKEAQSILEKVKAKSPKNAFRAEKDIIEVVFELRDNPDYLSKIESGAFNSGVDIDTVLMVGALDIRDGILKKLEMNPSDIDRGDVTQ